MLKNTADGYGWVAIVLHWLMALLILGLFALGTWMVELDYYDPWYHRAPALHKAIGVLTLILLCIRIGWRMHNPQPTLSGRPWERHAALTVHRLHYVLMATVMLAGYLIPTAKGQGIDVFGWFTAPALVQLDQRGSDLAGRIHWLAAWLLVALVIVHAAAALKHHFVDRDTTLLRMISNPIRQGGPQ